MELNDDAIRFLILPLPGEIGCPWRMRWTCLALLLAVPATAQAGAWPRGEGNVFASMKHTATTGREALKAQVAGAGALEIAGHNAIYAEFGLSPELTFGLDIGAADDLDTWTGLLFMRRSFQGDGPNVWAVEVAAGPRGLFGLDVDGVVRPSLQWGRDTGWGWLSVESYAEFRPGEGGTAWKLDATLGWRRSERDSLVAQVQTADYPGIEPTIRLAPSYVRRMSERLSVELGVVADVAGREDVGVTLGTWLEF